MDRRKGDEFVKMSVKKYQRILKKLRAARQSQEILRNSNKELALQVQELRRTLAAAERTFTEINGDRLTALSSSRICQEQFNLLVSKIYEAISVTAFRDGMPIFPSTPRSLNQNHISRDSPPRSPPATFAVSSAAEQRAERRRANLLPSNLSTITDMSDEVNGSNLRELHGGTNNPQNVSDEVNGSNLRELHGGTNNPQNVSSTSDAMNMVREVETPQDDGDDASTVELYAEESKLYLPFASPFIFVKAEHDETVPVERSDYRDLPRFESQAGPSYDIAMEASSVSINRRLSTMFEQDITERKRLMIHDVLSLRDDQSSDDGSEGDEYIGYNLARRRKALSPGYNKLIYPSYLEVTETRSEHETFNHQEASSSSSLVPSVNTTEASWSISGNIKVTSTPRKTPAKRKSSRSGLLDSPLRLTRSTARRSTRSSNKSSPPTKKKSVALEVLPSRRARKGVNYKLPSLLRKMRSERK